MFFFQANVFLDNLSRSENLFHLSRRKSVEKKNIRTRANVFGKGRDPVVPDVVGAMNHLIQSNPMVPLG